MVPNQPLLKTGMESLKIGLKARFTTKKYHLSEFHVRDLMEVTGFRGLVLPLRGTDEESFAERSLVAKKTLRDRKTWPHIAERLDVMVYPPASLV